MTIATRWRLGSPLEALPPCANPTCKSPPPVSSDEIFICEDPWQWAHPGCYRDMFKIIEETHLAKEVDRLKRENERLKQDLNKPEVKAVLALGVDAESPRFDNWVGVDGNGKDLFISSGLAQANPLVKP